MNIKDVGNYAEKIWHEKVISTYCHEIIIVNQWWVKRITIITGSIKVDDS